MAKQVFFLPRENSVTITPDAFASGYVALQTQAGEAPVYLQAVTASTPITVGSYNVDYFVVVDLKGGSVSKTEAFAGAAPTAATQSFDNTASGLTATTTEGAIDEVDAELKRRVNLNQADDVTADSDTTYTFSYLDGSLHEVTVSSNCTFAFTFPSSEVNSLLLNIVNGGGSTITWPAGVLWAGGTAPTLTTTGTDVVAFWTDASDTVYGNVVALDVKAVA
jgi:hypothetical protein